MSKIDSGQFLAILLDSELIRDIFVSDSGSSPNQRRISSESTQSFRFRLYSGRIGPNFFGRIRFWYNPCIIGRIYRRQIDTLPYDTFRLVQIESICRQQNKCNLRIEILFGLTRKKCGKRRKCWLPDE